MSKELDKLIEQMLAEKFALDQGDFEKIAAITNQAAFKSLANDDAKKNYFDSLAKLEPPPEKISFDDLKTALEVKNGLWAKSLKIVRPALYVLADAYNDSTDPTIADEAAELIKDLYYTLKPTSQLNIINKTVEKIFGKISSEEEAIAAQQLKAEPWNPPAFTTRAIDTQDVLDKNKQLGAQSSFPIIRVDENWAKGSKDAVPLLYQTALKSITGTTVEERLTQIATFFDALVNGKWSPSPSGGAKDKITETINKIILLQSVIWLSTQTTGQTGGWLFENLVAALAFGELMGENNKVEDVIVRIPQGSSDEIIGYSLKFKSTSDLSSALMNFIRWFYTSEEIEALSTRTNFGREVNPSDGTGAYSGKNRNIKDVPGKYGGDAGDLVMIYGDRSDDYQKIQFKSARIPQAEGKKMIELMFAKTNLTKLMKPPYNLPGSVVYKHYGNKDKEAGRDPKDILGNILSSRLVDLGPELDFSATNMQSIIDNANNELKNLSVDLEAINKSFENFKILILTYLQTFKAPVAAASKTEFETFRGKINSTYKAYGAATQLENKSPLDQLIEAVIKGMLK